MVLLFYRQQWCYCSFFIGSSGIICGILVSSGLVALCFSVQYNPNQNNSYVEISWVAAWTFIAILLCQGPYNKFNTYTPDQFKSSSPPWVSLSRTLSLFLIVASTGLPMMSPFYSILVNKLSKLVLNANHADS